MLLNVHFDPVGLGLDLRFCISNQLPGHVDTVGPGILPTPLSSMDLEESFLKASLLKNNLERSFKHRFLFPSPRDRFNRWSLII